MVAKRNRGTLQPSGRTCKSTLGLPVMGIFHNLNHYFNMVEIVLCVNHNITDARFRFNECAVSRRAHIFSEGVLRPP